MSKKPLLDRLPKALAARLRASDRWSSRTPRELAASTLGRALARFKARG